MVTRQALTSGEQNFETLLNEVLEAATNNPKIYPIFIATAIEAHHKGSDPVKWANIAKKVCDGYNNTYPDSRLTTDVFALRLAADLAFYYANELQSNNNSFDA